MEIELFITDIQDYLTHEYSKDTNFSLPSFSTFFPSPCTGPQVLLVTHYDCEENN